MPSLSPRRELDDQQNEFVWDVQQLRLHPQKLADTLTLAAVFVMEDKPREAAVLVKLCNQALEGLWH